MQMYAENHLDTDSGSNTDEKQEILINLKTNQLRRKPTVT